MPAPIAPAPTTPTHKPSRRPGILTTLKSWLWLFQEGAGAFRVVRGAARLALQVFLVIQLPIEVDAERLVECPFDQPQAACRLRCEVRRGAPCRFLQSGRF